MVIEIKYELNKWVPMIKDKFLTIKDVKTMEKGQKTIFLSLHRNFPEELDIKEEKVYEAIDFFKDVARIEYTHIGGIRGT